MHFSYGDEPPDLCLMEQTRRLPSPLSDPNGSGNRKASDQYQRQFQD